jgi:hypothetical protein
MLHTISDTSPPTPPKVVHSAARDSAKFSAELWPAKLITNLRSNRKMVAFL